MRMLSGADALPVSRSRDEFSRVVAAASEVALLPERASAPPAAADSLRNVRRSVDMRRAYGKGCESRKMCHKTHPRQGARLSPAPDQFKGSGFLKHGRPEVERHSAKCLAAPITTVTKSANG